MTHTASKFCRSLALLPLVPLAFSAGVSQARTVLFSGYEWDVRNASSSEGPGPNIWDERNVWVDEQGWLHLKITYRDGQWTCAEIVLKQRLGFGTFQFKVLGRPDLFDENVVLGMFTYTRPDLGPDGSNEIDIELAKWGSNDAKAGNWVVYPSQVGTRPTSQNFPIKLQGAYTTHRFHWSPNAVTFQALHGHRDDNANEMAKWTFSPKNPQLGIPQAPLPVHINFWLNQGKAPRDGEESEVVIAEFKHIDAFTP